MPCVLAVLESICSEAQVKIDGKNESKDNHC